jgi:type IV pilus assembly protein PilX
MRMHRSLPIRKRESGAALIVALIFLLIMSLLGTSSVRTSTMQERMAGNMRDSNVAFQRSEAGLRSAEQYLLSTNNLPEFNDTNGFYELNSDDRPDWIGTPTDPGTGGSVPYPGGCTVEAGDCERRYYIERLSSVRPAGSSTETGTPVEEIFYFRVTAVGYGAAADDGGTPLSAAVVGSVYRSR